MTIEPSNAEGKSVGGRTALTNVRVFDGRNLSEPRTVVMDGAVIGTDATDAEVVDADGGVLLPGLIDAHIHLDSRDNLEQLCSFGVTTALDMATWQPRLVEQLRGTPAVTDIRSAGTPVVGDVDPDAVPGVPPDLVREAIIGSPDDAEDGVAWRVAQGSDYIKIMLGPAGPGEQGGQDQATAEAVVAAAHAHGRKVVAHALTVDAYRMAVAVGVDVLTHVPLDRVLEPQQVSRIAAGGQVCVPTLTMMQAVAALGEAAAFAAALRTVAALYRAGVPIVAGTDANALPGVPFHVKHGQSLHHELELLVDAGLSTTDALRAATSLPARHFGLTDRGAIAPGLRADLILIDGDPLADIRATRNIARIWCGGTEHAPA
ncbi:amidohydrolase family protein [Rhodococcus spelaei]|uniref:Amidohydrolase family protein n=1 Tax=Rhodococcus spelaei TaxID=2546320 RepID=A0A541B220_9NOCA|nr:amidohydrolase family protein [Rhodococcus spelaei]TQF66359.1 amidohydrolase family protein [Rhodococcus spelaei]